MDGWPAGLDVAALRAAGHRPTPVREYVLKVHQRCNLACDYCYVYTSPDTSWRDRPAVMPAAVRRAAARRIGEHAAAHALPGVHVVLHGGEPLLAGVDRLLDLTAGVRAALPAGCTPRFSLQTNGVLLTEAVLAPLAAAGIRIGVSVDGAAAHHDRRRRDTAGRGSAGPAAAALRLLGSPAYRSAYAGLLCTVDPAADPLATYAALLAHRPPAVDLLLPHAHAGAPPPAPPGAYGAWLAAVFDRWYDAPHRPTRIRLFDALLRLLLGADARSEQVGLAPADLLVIESDGTYEQVDALKTAYPGAAATGLDVHADPVDAVLWHPGVVARQLGAAALAATCRACPLHPVCGGGHYAHRYRPGAGFRHPSVYCPDLTALITHVAGRLRADVARLRAR